MQQPQSPRRLVSQTKTLRGPPSPPLRRHPPRFFPDSTRREALETIMAKREFSTTLKNLKFMQRAAKQEVKPKEEEVKLQPDDVFGSSVALSKKCIVIMEGNPHPGAVNGRMSFQNFNPCINKMNQDDANSHKVQAFVSNNENQHATPSDRDNEHSSECTNRESPLNHPEIDHKRKKPAVETDNSHPQNSQRNLRGDGDGSSPLQNNRKNAYKQQKREKLDWNVLRPMKAQARRDSS